MENPNFTAQLSQKSVDGVTAGGKPSVYDVPTPLAHRAPGSKHIVGEQIGRAHV